MAKDKSAKETADTRDEKPVYGSDQFDTADSITADLPTEKETEKKQSDTERFPAYRVWDNDEGRFSFKVDDVSGKKTVDRKKSANGREEKKPKHSKSKKQAQIPKGIKNFLIAVPCIVIALIFAAMLLVRAVPDQVPAAAGFPEKIVSAIITPVQSAFSRFSEGIAGYFKKLKLRANIEQEYENLRIENEQLVYEAKRARELEIRLAQYEDIADVVETEANLNPITCTIVGKNDGNYFDTFTINRGSDDGISEYMAVTYAGSLVGYTETVNKTQSTVRTIIDSNASIAALIQSSRDQGTIRGTLGVDGTALCRMFYLPDDHLPRPGDVVVTSGIGFSFPKGIPIGKVRESTRGMDQNKQFVVVEPDVDFQHLEYVVVFRYKPKAEAVQGRSSSEIEFVPTVEARPVPELRIASTNYYSTDAPSSTEEVLPTLEAGATFTPSPSASPSSSAVPSDNSSPAPEGTEEPEYTFVPLVTGPTATPSPSPTPSPTPHVVLNPDEFVYEED